MKNVGYLLIGLTILVSCSKDDDNAAPVDLCAVANVQQESNYDSSNPCAIAVSNSGIIAVSAYNGGYGVNAIIKIYTNYDNFKNGVVKSSLEAIAPEAMAFDNDNNLYVSETESVAGIKVFDHIGDGAFAYKKTIQDNFNNPRGLAFDNQNRLFLADDGTGRIIRFDNPFNSNTYSTIGNWDTGIKGIAIRDNMMYVTNYTSGRVSQNRLKADGTLDELTAAVDFLKATDISIRGNRIIVTSYDTGKLGVFTACDFSDDKVKMYDNLGPAFGTGFINDAILLAATSGSDKVTQFKLF